MPLRSKNLYSSFERDVYLCDFIVMAINDPGGNLNRKINNNYRQKMRKRATKICV